MKKIITILFVSFLFVSCAQKAEKNNVRQEKKPVTQTGIVQIPDEFKAGVIPSDWKEFHSKTYNCDIYLPSDWKSVAPYDESLSEIGKDNFNQDPGFGFLETDSSPDKKERITFSDLSPDLSAFKCTSRMISINGQKVREVICPDSNNNYATGHYNYEFINKKITIVFDKKTPTVEKIISLIKFR